MASSSFALLRRTRHLSTAVATAATTDVTNSASMTISKAKSKLRTEHDTDKALDIYSTVKANYSASSPGSAHHAQQITVRRLAKSHRFSDIEALIESHKSDPRITDEHFLSSLIRSYGIAGMFEHALNTYNQMEALKTPRSALSFNALLTACLNTKNFDRAPLLFDEMPAKYRFRPDEYSYGILVKSFCDAGKPELAIDKLMTCYCKKGMMKEAKEVYEKLEEHCCQPNAATFRTLLFYLISIH